MSLYELIELLNQHPGIFAVIGISTSFLLIQIINIIQRNFAEDEWVYGFVTLDSGTIVSPARKNIRTGDCEFILWHKGENGHKEDCWHKFGEGHSKNFIQTNIRNPFI